MSSCHLRFRIWSWQELTELRSRRPWNMRVGRGKGIFFAWLVSKFECLSESLRELPKNDPSFIPDLQKSDSLGTRHGTLYLNMFPQVSGPGCEPPFQIRASLVAQTVKRLPAMQETRLRSLNPEDSLEKASYCSILAWEIRQTEEPGRLQFIGLQRVGQDWATNTFQIFSFHLLVHLICILHFQFSIEAWFFSQ